MKQFCLGIIVAIGLTSAAFGQEVDPLIGSLEVKPGKVNIRGFVTTEKPSPHFHQGGTKIN
jgi:hypothetical protein